MTQPDTGARDSSGREQDSHAARDAGSLVASLEDPRPGNGRLADGASDAAGIVIAGGVGGAADTSGEAAAGSDEQQDDLGAGLRPPVSAVAGALPPGQYVPRTLPILHYGPVPAFRSETWDLRICGATASGDEAKLGWEDIGSLPVSEVTADFHCVTKFTVPGLCWSGVLAADLLCRFPPAAAVTHVMIWADFGYSANVRISDFAADDTILATHRNGEPLTPEHGYPLRLVVPSLYAWKSVKWVRAVEYMTADRRGFWEERGYHNTADPWREQRYSYQELEGEGPPV